MKKVLFIATILISLCNISSAQQAAGVIKGVIVDKIGTTPLPFVVVSVVNNNRLSAITNEQGEYQISGIKAGYVSLSVNATGYSPLITDNFLVSNAYPTIKNIELEPLSVYVDEVVVTVSPYRNTIESPVSSMPIRKEEIEKTPGGNRDISKVVQSSPGVVTTPSHRNDILVRGGGANENKFYLDGIEIPVLNHFSIQGGSGGNASLVNTDFLSGVTFFTSAFPANYSNALSSVMDMQLSAGNSERFKGKLTLGASDLGVAIDSPISKNGKTTFIGSYRRSYLQLLFSVLKLPFLPTYNDYQFKINTKFNDRNELSFVVIGSVDNNKLNLNIKDPDDSQNYMLGYLPENKQKSYTVGAVYKHKLEDGNIRLVLSRNYFQNYLYKYKNNNTELNKTLDINSNESDNRFRAEITKRLPKEYNISAGISTDFGNYNSDDFQMIYYGDQSVKQHYTSKLNIINYGAFASLNKSYFHGHLLVSAGFRIDGSSYNKATSNPLKQLSPRLSLTYRANNKLSISALAAKYYGLPSYTALGYRDKQGVEVNKDNGVKYIGTAHFVAGFHYTPSSTSKLTIEGFYKKYTDYPVSLIDSLPLTTSNFEDYTIGNVPLKSVAKGRAYGTEISYRNSDLKNTVINMSYTLLYSEFQKPGKDLKPTSKYQSSGWDVRHIVNIMAIHKFNRNWDLGLKWRMTGGSPYTPYDIDMTSRIEAWDARKRPYIDYSQYNSYRFRPFHQLDIRVDKTFFFNKWTFGIYFDVQNVYNYKTDGQDIIMPYIDNNGDYVKDPNKPGHYKMKSVKNNIGGTVLPTLGIIIEF